MIRRWVAVYLMLSIASPAYGQDFGRSIERAIAEAGALPPAQTSGRIPPGLFWSGIGLLGAGGLFLALGVAEDPDSETCVVTDDFDRTCISNRTALLATGGVMAGVGGLLLAVGVARRNSPQVAFRPGGFSVHHTIPLDWRLGSTRRR
jgi:hypothetical protein